MKSFKINIILRVILITLLLTVTVYFFLVDSRYLRATYFLVFSILAVVELIAYNNRTNRDISTFLLSLLQQDFTTTFHAGKKGDSFSNMYAAFNEVTDRFKELSLQKEARHQYLEALIEHVQIGLISFDGDGRVHLVNDTFRRYAGVNAIRDLEDFRVFQSELYTLISRMRAGQDQVVRLETERGLVPLNVHMTEFIQDEKTFYLVSVQNIRQALDTQEVESYQKLIRVLTHEIMNSVSPINSLSESLFGMVSRADVVEGGLRQNVEKGLQAIQVRSKGLETFTEAYKQLTRIPRPHFDEMDVAEWVERVVRLAGEDIQLDLEVGLKIQGDERLLEQVLINLVRNAMDATDDVEAPEVRIATRKRGSFAEIEVSDNGAGIPADKLDKIFIPFFTTKEKGSGIGLALSRQIIKMHGGSIDVESEEGRGARVTIRL